MKRFALFGSTIERSPSPAMHNAAFAALGLDAEYVLRSTGLEDAESAFEELRSSRWSGANVTTPLKTILATRVALQDDAQAVGAVNTLWCRRGQWLGSLTDVAGIFVPLQERNIQPGGEALVLGAGGATRAAVLALQKLNMTVHVAARNPEKAASIVSLASPKARGSALSLTDLNALRSLFPRLATVIQATPVGRQGDAHDLPWEYSRASLIAFDMLYWPRCTPFLQSAQDAGCQRVEGVEMLVHQGAESFFLWTGQQPPRDIMLDAAVRFLDRL